MIDQAGAPAAWGGGAAGDPSARTASLAAGRTAGGETPAFLFLLLLRKYIPIGKKKKKNPK